MKKPKRHSGKRGSRQPVPARRKLAGQAPSRKLIDQKKVWTYRISDLDYHMTMRICEVVTNDETMPEKGPAKLLATVISDILAEGNRGDSQ